MGEAQSGGKASGRRRRLVWGTIAGAILALAVAAPVMAAYSTSPQYNQVNLISDIHGVARITDPHLVNPWGQASAPGGPLWVADNNSNVATVYTGGVNGSIPVIATPPFTIPFGAPTGNVYNPTSSFNVTTSSGTAPATFIFDSETGWVDAWSASVSGSSATAEFVSSTAVYKGLALASFKGASYLYATNFHDNSVDVLNGSFQKVTLPGSFKDPTIPSNFAPFGIKLIGGKLFITYAEQDAAKHDPVHGAGLGYVDEFSTGGIFLKRLVTQGALNAPWGLVLTPSTFGGLGGDLFVGNFGDGGIHAYNPTTGALAGTLTNTDGNPIQIDGLWDLRFGDGSFGSTSELVFTAGIAAESHGLLGEITPAG